jgi:hypothetical protein
MTRLRLAKLKREADRGLLPDDVTSITEHTDAWISGQSFGNEALYALIPTTANPSADRFLQGIMYVN